MARILRKVKTKNPIHIPFENVIWHLTIDVTFRVKPDPGQCIVSYVVQGDIPADYHAPEADIVKEGETYTVKSVPEPVVDYKFSGWYDEDQNIVTEFTVTGDVTLTGIWTYTGKKDLWDTVYGTIRVYMDEGTEADFDNTGFNLNKQVRLYSENILQMDIVCADMNPLTISGTLPMRKV